MKTKLRFGVLGAARIGLNKVLPAMMRGERTTVAAIASRDLAKAREAATQLGIAKSYGSYEELLDDPEIDAIYNPLPNHLHLPWTQKAAEAGKHVLCEKPIGLTVAEARSLVAVRDRCGVQIAEAFMIRCHPQWLRLRELLDAGRIGQLRAIQGIFSYFNAKPENIRNHAEYGGGGVYDIGCYLIQAARYAFRSEPKRVVALLERDPEMKIDRLASALMDFESGQVSWICSTQMIPHQRLTLLGTKGRIEIEIPFNAPPDRATRMLVDSTGSLDGSGIENLSVPAVDQYTLQGDAFARAVYGEGYVPVSLEDAIGNMAVIEAIFRSSVSGHWETPQR